jgi:DNA-binding XRE family transcriptional regulator
MERHGGLQNEIGRLAHRLGMSDGAVARAAGLSRAHLNRIKNGRVVPRVDAAIAVARALGTPVRRVFRLRDSRDAG